MYMARDHQLALHWGVSPQTPRVFRKAARKMWVNLRVTAVVKKVYEVTKEDLVAARTDLATSFDKDQSEPVIHLRPQILIEPPSKFKEVFAKARAEGRNSTYLRFKRVARAALVTKHLEGVGESEIS